MTRADPSDATAAEGVPSPPGPPARRQRQLAIGLWLVLLVAGWWSWQRLDAQRAVSRICDAVAVADWPTALDGSERWVGTSAPGRRVSECRALALMATGEVPAAVELLERQLAAEGNRDWVPDPLLVMLVADDRQKQGRLPAAIELVQRANGDDPTDPDLQYLELDLRSRREPPTRVLDDLTARLEAMGPAAPLLRIRIAQRRLARREVEPARALLGDSPPPTAGLPGGDGWRDEWFRVRSALAGVAADPADLAEVVAAWRVAGGNDDEVLAWHALTRSLYQVHDPALPTLTLLESAVERCPAAGEWLCSTLARRLLGTYQVAGRTSDALALYDALAGQVDVGLSRQEILRSEAIRELESAGNPEAPPSPARVRFRIDQATAAAAQGDLRLWVTPSDDEPVDSPYRPYPIGSERPVEVLWREGVAPLRWVLRRDLGMGGTHPDTDGPVLASGSSWPAAGQALEIRVRPQEDGAVTVATTLDATSGDAAARDETTAELRRPADGHRRVLVVILDCADWRLVQYLRARGELPSFGSLLRRGHRAVVESRPAFTAAAIDALTHPAAPQIPTPLARLHELGIELASNTFVGGNPVASLGWLLPERRGLFATLGSGDRVVVNLLFSEGGVDGGRHGEQVGPGGQRRRFTDWRRRRPLDPEVASGLGHLLDDPNRRAWIEEMAADFDTAETVADDPEIDFLMLRIDPLDPATHAGFAEVAAGGQDDGRPGLFDFYRYADRRLASVERRLDGDDVLVVMSDHGIRTSMEHSPWAFFVAVGEGIEPGRSAGTPSLRGVPRRLADWLGVATEWPTEGWANETSDPDGASVN